MKEDKSIKNSLIEVFYFSQEIILIYIIQPLYKVLVEVEARRLLIGNFH